MTVQPNQENDTVESSLNKELDGFQRKFGQKFDILQESISKLTNQLVHQEEENPEEVCLSDTMVEEQCLQQPQEGLVENFESSDHGVVVSLWEKKEATSPLLIEESSGQETVEGTQEPIIQPNPVDLDPNATAKPKNNPLPVYILPTPAAQPTPGAPTGKATSIALPVLQKFKKLVATVRAYATTLKTQATTYIAWYNSWFGCRFGFGAPEPRHF